MQDERHCGELKERMKENGEEFKRIAESKPGNKVSAIFRALSLLITLIAIIPSFSLLYYFY